MKEGVVRLSITGNIRFLVTWPAIIKETRIVLPGRCRTWITGWWRKPVFRWRAWLVLYVPEVQVFQYFSDDIRFIDKADDLHFSLAMRTLQGIDLPHLLYALPPGRRRDLFRLVCRDIVNFDFVI